jgi:hypothetical protein
MSGKSYGRSSRQPRASAPASFVNEDNDSLDEIENSEDEDEGDENRG